MSIENNPLTDTPLWLPEEWKDNKHPLAVQVSGDSSGWKVTYNLTVPRSLLWLYMPEIGTSIEVDDPPDFAGLQLSTRNVAKRPGNMTALTLVFEPPQVNSWQNPEDFSTVYTMDDGGIEIALEKHADYKTKWNHSLCKKTGTTQVKPSDWVTTKTNKIADKSEWHWYADGDAMETGWEVVEQREKPFDFFIVPAPIVNETKYYRLKASANSAAAGVGSISTPGDTFGISGGSWLKRSASVQFNGRMWEASVQYQWAAKGWDTDLY